MVHGDDFTAEVQEVPGAFEEKKEQKPRIPSLVSKQEYFKFLLEGILLKDDQLDGQHPEKRLPYGRVENVLN